MPTIAILSPGEMGAAIGSILRAHGHRVVSNLAERSKATVDRARLAGIEDVGSDEALVGAADQILAILVPSEAVATAQRIVAAGSPGRAVTYVDCNAIAPQTASRVEAVVTAVGYGYTDAGIIGPPPSDGSPQTRIYVSGTDTSKTLELNSAGLDVRHVSRHTGDASALKMCYAAMTKGMTALATQLFTAARHLNVDHALAAEFEISQRGLLERAGHAVPGMVPKAHRWVGEMEEIAATFEACGLSPDVFRGAAATYAQVAAWVADSGSTGRDDCFARDFEAALADLEQSAS